MNTDPAAERPTQSGSYSHRRGGDSYDYDDDDYRKKKAPYSKPIPREFEKAWKSTGSQQAEEGGEARARQIPSLLSNMSQQSNAKSTSGGQPIGLMELMSTKLEPSSNPRNTYGDKKKYDNNRGGGGQNFKKRRNENFNDFD